MEKRTRYAGILENNSQCSVGLCTCTPYSLTDALLCTCPAQTLTPPSYLLYESVFSAPANPTTFPKSISLLFNFSPLIPSLASSHSADDLTFTELKKQKQTENISMHSHHRIYQLTSKCALILCLPPFLPLTPPVSLASSGTWIVGFPGGAVVKNPPANAGDTGSSPRPGRSHMPRSN